MNSLDWNDLRYVTAIVSVGSAAAAARRLGVSHATVLRRIQALEKGIGTPLFYRLPTGYEPTEAGGKLAEMGAAMESAITDTRRTIDGQTKALAGSILFSTTDSFACVLMPPVLKTFRERYPAIEVEMIATNSRLDLDRREADVVLRPTVQPPESWVGTQLGRLDFGLYAAAAYAEKQNSQDWRTFDWVAPGGPLALRSMTAWLTRQVDSDRWVITVDSFVAMRELVLQGIGAAILPHFMGHDKRLQLLHALPHDMSRFLWLLTHKNLSHHTTDQSLHATRFRGDSCNASGQRPRQEVLTTPKAAGTAWSPSARRLPGARLAGHRSRSSRRALHGSRSRLRNHPQQLQQNRIGIIRLTHSIV